MYAHTQLRKKLDGTNPEKCFGVWVANEWFWYDSWIEECKRQCEAVAKAGITCWRRASYR